MNITTITYTGKSELLRAYKNMPQTGELTVHVHLQTLKTCLVDLEETGFCAIFIRPPLGDHEPIRVSAYKGKQGPCYDTGRTAIYKGIAKAAIDDDNHVLIANQEAPVCEKTANVYQLPPYRSHISCTPPVDELYKKLGKNPVVFGCNTFEVDLSELHEQLRHINPQKDRCILFYPGPFKFIILEDGSVVRRGAMNNVPASLKGRLMKEEGMFMTAGKEQPEMLLFRDVFEKSGTAFFLYTGEKTGRLSQAETTDFTVLKDVSASLKAQFTDVVRNKKNYFIIIGSSPDDLLGCCPSTEVEEAGLLVKAGILSSYGEPVQEGACPVTTYAFKNEIQIKEDQILFTPDFKFRKEVLKHLGKKPVTTAGNILKWILLAFVLASLVIAIYRISDRTPVRSDISLFEQLNPAHENQVMVVLFHFRERCETCLNMEQYTRDFLDTYNARMNERDKIQFKLAVINDDRNLNLVRRFHTYTSTIVLVEFENGEEKHVKALNNAWQLYRDKEAYTAMLENEVESFIHQRHE